MLQRRGVSVRRRGVTYHVGDGQVPGQLAALKKMIESIVTEVSELGRAAEQNCLRTGEQLKDILERLNRLIAQTKADESTVKLGLENVQIRLRTINDAMSELEQFYTTQAL
jgi:hypothetical protein